MSRTQSSMNSRKPKPQSPLVNDIISSSSAAKKNHYDSGNNKKNSLPQPPVLPPVQGAYKRTNSSPSAEETNHFERSSACSSCVQRRKLPSLHDVSDRITRLNQSREKSDLHLASRSRRGVLKPLNHIDTDENKHDKILRSSIQDSKARGNELANSSEAENYKRLLNWVQPKEMNPLEKSGAASLRSVSRNLRTTPELKLSSRLVSCCQS